MIMQTGRPTRGSHNTSYRPLLVVAILGLLALVAASCSSDPPAPPPPPDEATEAGPIEVSIPDRSRPPLIAGVSMPVLDPAEGPEPPAQWGGDKAAVPSGRWWSSAAAEPGIHALWSYPLLLRLEPNGRANLGTPSMLIRDDGYPDANSVPTLFLELGEDVEVSVLDEGAFHVRFRLTTADADLTVTMVQGSPLFEVEGTGLLTMTIPGRGELEDSVVPGVRTMATATGTWLVASERGTDRDWTFDGDLAELRFSNDSRWVLGPAPTATPNYLEAARSVAATPLDTTTESLERLPDGAVRQTLRQERGSSQDGVAWTLLAHQSDHLQPAPTAVATIDTPRGALDVVVLPELVLDYPPVPILWDPVAADESGETPRPGDLPPETNGSYFGGKYAYTAALASQLDGDDADELLAIADQAVSALIAPGAPPQTKWEPNWGSVVISPAEFGSGVDLNDHQLQYGYWVGAASIIASAAKGEVNERMVDTIDLIIADYGGGLAVPHWQGVVADHSTWGAYDGHSWASGTSRFGAGNNLESISESSFSWWAAARWFIATGRPELADPFISRLTIESWVTHYQWLPTAEHQWPDVRPWSGVVWASKVDPGTWFHASNEAALGIRLLPVGPQSFSRYPNAATVRAASTRWDWCETEGSDCLERWGNLLDSDAVVARRPELPPTAHPEESTLRAVTRWWRTHWETTELAQGWSCSAGAIARLRPDGSVVALITNPGPTELAVQCQSPTGEIVYETSAAAHSSSIEPIG